MSDIKTVEGDFRSVGGNYVLLVARFNSFIVDKLQEGALDVLKRHGVPDSKITIVKVPGAFEMPVAAKRIAESSGCDAIIALGAVIRGGTPHFDYVAGECVKGLGQVGLNSGIPVTFGVLTVDSIEQAIERAGTKAGNKGAEAAITAVEMVSVLQQFP